VKGAPGWLSRRIVVSATPLGPTDAINPHPPRSPSEASETSEASEASERQIRGHFLSPQGDQSGPESGFGEALPEGGV
jgi:hypothetical protein